MTIENSNFPMLKQLIDIQCYNMKKCKKIKNTPKYAFGANAIQNWGSMDGLEKANTVTSGIGAVGSMIGNATSGQKPTAAGVISGIGSGAAAGASIGGPWGAVIGGVMGGITSSIGSGGSVNEQTGEYQDPSGIAGLFGHSKHYIRNKAAKIKNGIQARNMSEQVAAEYYQNNGYNDLTLAKGGIVPNTIAYLDDGELIRTPDGIIGSIPEEHKPTDSNLVNVPVGTQVLSDKLKVPGTNKTFAEMGKKLMKKSNKKANNIYAENSQMLNERNNQIAYQTLLDQQEAMKSKINKKKKNIPAYSVGNKDIKPYGYNKNMSDFKYWDPNKNNYTQDYLNWVNSITEQDVKDIYSGKYGDMSTYLSKNKGVTPSVEQARSLMTDRKYGDWHKIGQAYVDNKSGITRSTIPSITKFGRNTQDFTKEPIALKAPIGNVDSANSRGQLFDYTGDPGKLPVGTPYLAGKENPNDIDNDNDWSSLINNIAALAGPIGNIFSGSSEKVDTYTYDPVYGPTEYNIDPMIREANLTNRIARYNMANINPNTGASMAFGLQSSVQRDKAIADAYNIKNNVENQLAFKNAEIGNAWSRYTANARHVASVEQAQNDATTRNIRRKGFGDLSTRIQQINKDKRLIKRDSAMLEAMLPYLEYGMTSDQLTRLYNNLKR